MATLLIVGLLFLMFIGSYCLAKHLNRRAERKHQSVATDLALTRLQWAAAQWQDSQNSANAQLPTPRRDGHPVLDNHGNPSPADPIVTVKETQKSRYDLLLEDAD